MPASSPTKIAHQQELRWRKHACSASCPLFSFCPVADRVLGKTVRVLGHAELFEPILQFAALAAPYGLALSVLDRQEASLPHALRSLGDKKRLMVQVRFKPVPEIQHGLRGRTIRTSVNSP